MWEVWYELGHALMVAKEWKSALSVLERGRQESLKFQFLPAITNFCSAMAQCYLNLNNKLSARVMVNEALQGDPNNAEALEVQGQL